MNAVILFKALADSSRLQLLRELLPGPLCTEVLCERLKLAPSTISHHAAKLVEAGLITITREQQLAFYSIENDILETRLREILAVAGEVGGVVDGRKEAYRRKVLASFVEFGRLKSIPVQRKKRRIILEQIVSGFDPGREYTEKEISLLLANWHEDYCLLRRELVDEKLMTRQDGVYQRVEE